MRNVTVTLDEQTARWARIEAARRDTSMSGLLRDLLTREMRAEERYDEAMSEFLAHTAAPLKRRGRYPKRDEVYDRAGLR